MTTNDKARKAVSIILVLVAVGLLGYMLGFNTAVGGFAFGASWGQSTTPPSDIARATLAEVKETLAPMTQIEYREGFNCMDFAWEAMRLLHWNGQLAIIAQLDLEPGPDHAVLLIPTSDEGWVFLEPQTGKQIYPTPGGKYIDFTATIEGVYVMDLEWVSIDDLLLEVSEGAVNTTALSYYGR